MLPPLLQQLLENPSVGNEYIWDAIEDLSGKLTVADVFVVCGKTGEYSDQSLWDVAAFLDETKANALCQELNAWCVMRGIGWKQNKAIARAWDDKNRPEHDEKFYCDYTGVDYSVSKIPLRG